MAARAVDAAVDTKGWKMRVAPEQMLATLEEDMCLTPDALYQGLVYGGSPWPAPVEVLAWPGQKLETALQPGDVLVRVACGQPGLGHFAVLVDGRLLPRDELVARGATAETATGASMRLRRKGRTTTISTRGRVRPFHHRRAWVPPPGPDAHPGQSVARRFRRTRGGR